MIDADLRFRVNAAAVRRLAAQVGKPAPSSAAIEQLRFAAMYAGIAYTAGEEGKTLTDALPIFRASQDGHGLALDLDAIREQTGGDPDISAAFLETLDRATSIIEAAYNAGKKWQPIADAVPFLEDLQAREIDAIFKQ